MRGHLASASFCSCSSASISFCWVTLYSFTSIAGRPVTGSCNTSSAWARQLSCTPAAVFLVKAAACYEDAAVWLRPAQAWSWHARRRTAEHFCILTIAAAGMRVETFRPNPYPSIPVVCNPPLPRPPFAPCKHCKIDRLAACTRRLHAGSAILICTCLLCFM